MTASSSSSVLFIGYVWPEPNASAAGFRDMQLVEIFLQEKWRVAFASASRDSPHRDALRARGIETHVIKVNDPSFDALIERLRPDCVIFDRFVTEEQFGWRVRRASPGSVRILDTQDLHFLRRARMSSIRENPHSPVLATRPTLEELSMDDTALREIAAIFRSDRTLVLSDFELDLLKDVLGVPAELLGLCRFAYRAPSVGEWTGFERRSDFVMIGNFRHPPNRDGVHWFHREIWPLIRERLPGAQVDIYGAYPSKDVMSLDDAATGFRVKGWAQDQYATLRNYRVNLAPLRFGAGIKGKITDGWWCGTPVVTTSAGAEGMSGGLPWGGAIADDPSGFAEEAARLHLVKEDWEQARRNGEQILRSQYDFSTNAAKMISDLKALRNGLASIRARNFTGSMLWHHFYLSTMYFSRWIESKEGQIPKENSYSSGS